MKLYQLVVEGHTATDAELEFYVNAKNWPKELEAAKEFARNAILTFQWKKKAPKFLAAIDNASTVKRVQQIVINPILSGEGIGVVK